MSFDISPTLETLDVFQHYPTTLGVSLMFLNVFKVSPTLLIVLGIFLAIA
jgi:hypothetical protein